MAKRILIVDDEPDLVRTIGLRLQRAGYEVLSATDGVMATQVATLGQKRVKPTEYFSPSAQVISRNPASSSANQAIRINRPWLCRRGLACLHVAPVKAVTVVAIGCSRICSDELLRCAA